MPAVNAKFLAAMNGTTFDSNGYAQTSIAAGQRNLAVAIINEEFATVPPAWPGAYLMDASGHSLLSTLGATPGQGGTLVVSGATYGVTVNNDGTAILVNQTSS